MATSNYYRQNMQMTVKGVKLKSESFFSISCGVLELRRKNPKGADSAAPSPDQDRVKKNVKKLLRNFDYSKSQKAKKLSVLGPDLSFLYKKVCIQMYLDPIKAILTLSTIINGYSSCPAFSQFDWLIIE